MRWWYVFAVWLGLLAILTGVLARAGKVRGSYPLYRATAAPFYIRNRQFGLIPFGCFFLALAGVAVAARHGSMALAVGLFVLV